MISFTDNENGEKKIYIIKRKNSKTGKALRMVFPEREKEIMEYEDVRAKFDSGSTLYKTALQRISAKFEVYVNNKLEKVKENLRKVDETNSLEISVGNDIDLLKNQLKILTGLKKHFR